MEMPEIKTCDVTECAYNNHSRCHALAITIGDASSSPKCDTFWQAATRGGDASRGGRVGACHMDNCMFNDRLECQKMDGILVGHQGNEPDCLVFKSA